LTEHAPLSLKEALAASPHGILAEFKRRSPSKGAIAPQADVTAVVRSYAQAGAAALSVLTDATYFGGSFHDFKRARKAVPHLPLLRKDFIVDEYQVHQSKVLGADAILLIAACLSKREVEQLSGTAKALQLEVLLEIHHEDELSCWTPDIDLIGVNNRDLTRFCTDTARSLQLAEKIPPAQLRISESGLSDAATVRELRAAGYRGFLIGGYFMQQASPGDALADFLAQL
jgi:indole-3-glycerol phosphate synthase